jgi:hypothetical protein
VFEKTIDYARESLIAASEAAVDRAGDRLGQVVDNASQAIDEKLDKISQELHSQRSMTKDDVREMVDYAAERLTVVLDERIAVMRREITGLVEEKTEYFKSRDRRLLHQAPEGSGAGTAAAIDQHRAGQRRGPGGGRQFPCSTRASGNGICSPCSAWCWLRWPAATASGWC